MLFLGFIPKPYKVKGRGINVMGGDLTWGGEHTTQYTDDI